MREVFCLHEIKSSGRSNVNQSSLNSLFVQLPVCSTLCMLNSLYVVTMASRPMAAMNETATLSQTKATDIGPTLVET